jgi:hypothetical protein
MKAKETTSDPKEAAILREMDIIKNDANWYVDIKKKALKNGVSIADQLRGDATYMIENVDGY